MTNDFRDVSIPFIAGQWSLLRSAPDSATGPGLFQSPSLRGSGRFARAQERARKEIEAFQSPSLRGSGRFIRIQVHRFNRVKFQSPSLRGSGRFSHIKEGTSARRGVSIPFIAGQWSLP